MELQVYYLRNFMINIPIICLYKSPNQRSCAKTLRHVAATNQVMSFEHIITIYSNKITRETTNRKCSFNIYSRMNKWEQSIKQTEKETLKTN